MNSKKIKRIRKAMREQGVDPCSPLGKKFKKELLKVIKKGEGQ